MLTIGLVALVSLAALGVAVWSVTTPQHQGGQAGTLNLQGGSMQPLSLYTTTGHRSLTKAAAALSSHPACSESYANNQVCTDMLHAFDKMVGYATDGASYIMQAGSAADQQNRITQFGAAWNASLSSKAFVPTNNKVVAFSHDSSTPTILKAGESSWEGITDMLAQTSPCADRLAGEGGVCLTQIRSSADPTKTILVLHYAPPLVYPWSPQVGPQTASATGLRRRLDARRLWSNKDFGGAIVSGAASGAAVGAIGDGVGAAPGAAVGAIGGAVTYGATQAWDAGYDYVTNNW